VPLLRNAIELAQKLRQALGLVKCGDDNGEHAGTRS
jgi:hypothetical protein